jgi:hypothetical protein
MADVLTWFLIVVGLYVTLVCWWLGSAALFPEAVAFARARYARPWSALALGLVVALPLFALGASGANAPPPLGGAAKALLFLLGVPAVFGSAGLAARIGAGLPSAQEGEPSWRAVRRGGVVLAGAFLLPFVGWLILIPFTLVSGFGVSLLAARERRAAAQARRAEAVVKESA